VCSTAVVSFCENFLDFGKMILIIVGTVVLGAMIWFLAKNDPEPLLGIYSQPGITDSCACILSYSYSLYIYIAIVYI